MRAIFLAIILTWAVPASAGSLELAESVPVETSLDDPAIGDAGELWVSMIDGARRSLDIAEFYTANEPGSRLETVVAAIERAAQRGVAVRMITDARFRGDDGVTLDRLAAAGVQVRRLDLKERTGGVLHAKYFLVDGTECWIGSQNFDWRSLDQVLELGVRIRDESLTGALGRVFAMDWEIAGGGEPRPDGRPAPGPVEVDYGGTTVRATLVASPESLLPEPGMWDLPHLERLIGAARARVRVQLLDYATIGYDGVYWDRLDRALRAAAARGVSVEILVSDWATAQPKLEALQSLAAIRNITVGIVHLPEWSGGFVPYARTIHSKFLVVDGESAWIGTSNWSGDYFLASRNVGLVVEGAAFAAALERRFAITWEGPHSEGLDAGGSYTPPRKH